MYLLKRAVAWGNHTKTAIATKKKHLISTVEIVPADNAQIRLLFCVDMQEV